MAVAYTDETRVGKVRDDVHVGCVAGNADLVAEMSCDSSMITIAAGAPL